jgi:hypothetical protein
MSTLKRQILSAKVTLLGRYLRRATKATSEGEAKQENLCEAKKDSILTSLIAKQ